MIDVSGENRIVLYVRVLHQRVWTYVCTAYNDSLHQCSKKNESIMVKFDLLIFRHLFLFVFQTNPNSNSRRRSTMGGLPGRVCRHKQIPLHSDFQVVCQELFFSFSLCWELCELLDREMSLEKPKEPQPVWGSMTLLNKQCLQRLEECRLQTFDMDAGQQLTVTCLDT